MVPTADVGGVAQRLAEHAQAGLGEHRLAMGDLQPRAGLRFVRHPLPAGRGAGGGGGASFFAGGGGGGSFCASAGAAAQGDAAAHGAAAGAGAGAAAQGDPAAQGEPPAGGVTADAAGAGTGRT